MKQTIDRETLFRLFAALANSVSRQHTAYQLALYLDAHDLLIFLQDEGAGTLLPAPGFARTLPDERRWRRFLTLCAREEGPVQDTLPFPDVTTMSPAVGFAGDSGVTLVLVGGMPRIDDVISLRALLPLLGVIFRYEQGWQRSQEERAEMARVETAQTELFLATVADTSLEVQNRAREHANVEAALREQIRLASLHMEVSTALTTNGTLRQSLEKCAAALVRYLNAAFVRFWTLNEAEQVLELQASAGIYTWLNGAHARIPVGSLKVGRIASERRPYLTNAVVGDPHISDQEWARREGMVAFAGYPLLVEDRLVGVVALFARHQLTEAALEAMASIANATALGIERYRAEEIIRRNADLLRQDRERLLFMAESMPQKIFTATPAGAVDYLNPQWLEFTGLSFEEIRGWGWVRFIHPDDVEENVRRWQHAVESGEPFYIEHRFRRVDGVYRWHVTRATPVRNAQGHITMWIGSNTDITEQKDLEHQREILVSMATHELKTPLTSLQGYIQLAERQLRRLQNMLPTEQKEQRKLLERALSMLDRSQQQLSVQSRLVTDLLDVSRMQESTLELRLAPCNLVDLVSETVRDHQATYSQRLITLELPEQVVLPVQVDRDRIVQVLSNYLANALKYSADDEVILVGIVREHAMVRVRVTDQGPGLSREAQEHIWERFYRAPEVMVKNRSGVSLGLGLPICQGLIKAHRGQVGVESIPGRGAQFWFTLPLCFEETAPSE